MAIRDLKNRYAGSYLGIFWTVVVPLLTSLVYILVFSFIMRGQMSGEFANLNFTVFYFTGYTPWILFNETLPRSLGTIKENSNIIKNVSFPSQILPFSVFLSSLVTHLVLVFVCIILLICYDIPLSNRFYMIFIYFGFLFFITIGLSLFFAAVSVFITDLFQIISILINLMFFLTPILYPYHFVLDNAPRWAHIYLLKLNPFHHIVQGYRLSLIKMDIPIDFDAIFTLSVYSLIFVLIGAYVFKKLKPSFNDVL